MPLSGKKSHIHALLDFEHFSLDRTRRSTYNGCSNIREVFPAILIKVLERAFCQEHNNLVLAYQILHVKSCMSWNIWQVEILKYDAKGGEIGEGIQIKEKNNEEGASSY